MDALDHMDWQERWHPHGCMECLDEFMCCCEACAKTYWAVCRGCAGEREAVEMWQEAT